jgi:hypothetical protein
MPTAFPATEWPEEIEVRRLAAQISTRAPASFAEQVYDHGGRAWNIAVKLQRLDRARAGVILAWLTALDGMAETFTLDLDPWCPGVSPAPGSKEFRLVSSTVQWRAQGGVAWEIQFDAQETIPISQFVLGSAIASAEAFGAATVSGA